MVRGLKLVKPLIMVFGLFLVGLPTGQVWAQTDPSAGCASLQVHTALGCVDTTPDGVVTWALGKLLGLGGAVAMFLILKGLLVLATSGGDAQKVKAATEGVTAAIAGLVMIIFAVLILKIIGVDILRLPGFTSS